MDVSWFIAGSFIGHFATLAMLSFTPPELNVLGAATDAQHLPKGHAVHGEDAAWEVSPRTYGVRAACVTCNFGDAGDPQTENEEGRYGIAGPLDNPDPHVARTAIQYEPKRHIGAGDSPGLGGSPDAPITSNGRDDSLGTAPLDARGTVHDVAIAPSNGRGGHGLIVTEPSLRRGYRCRMP